MKKGGLSLPAGYYELTGIVLRMQDAFHKAAQNAGKHAEMRMKKCKDGKKRG